MSTDLCNQKKKKKRPIRRFSSAATSEDLGIPDPTLGKPAEAGSTAAPSPEVSPPPSSTRARTKSFPTDFPREQAAVSDELTATPTFVSKKMSGRRPVRFTEPRTCAVAGNLVFSH